MGVVEGGFRFGVKIYPHNNYYIDGKGGFIIVSSGEKINYSLLGAYIKNLQLFMSFFNTSYMRAKYSDS